MKSGFKLLWSDRASDDLRNIINYLSENWTQKEIKKFAKRLEKRLQIITINHRLYPLTKKRKNVRRSVLTKQTIVYYQVTEDTITIVTLFDARRNPSKLKL